MVVRRHKAELFPTKQYVYVTFNGLSQIKPANQ